MHLKVCFLTPYFLWYRLKKIVGFNCSIFAYGQTGSGKSYSMLGYNEEKGLIPRVCEEMYNRILALKNENPEYDCKVEVSFMEIYNELVFDLLNPKNNKKGGLKVRNHPTTGPYVEDLSKLVVHSYAEIDSLMDEGGKARTVAATNMNATSSRSHAVFSIVLTQTISTSSGFVKNVVSKIHMVDLAGSERATSTGASGQRLKEGANINKSLSALGKVISALAKKSEGKKNVFVPYRDSILTWLLRESLGGNSKTIMLAALSPADLNYEETLSTLRYADSAKQIKNSAVVNEDPTEKLIRELNEEIERLKELLRKKEDEDKTNGPNNSEIDTTLEPSANEDENSIQYLKTQLQQSEKLMHEVGKTWDEKVAESKQIQKERTTALKAQGISLGIEESSLPNLVNLNEDPILSGSLIYILHLGTTIVGQKNGACAIQLSGLGVGEHHCTIENTPDSEVYLYPGDGQTFVNGILVTQPRRLLHGSRIIFGNNHIFRFNHPREAEGKRGEEVMSEPQDIQQVDYNFALSERAEVEVAILLENTLHFDITKEDEELLQQKMKAFYEDKLKEKDKAQNLLLELKKRKAELDIIDYQQQKQAIQSTITSIDTALLKQKERFSTFSFRVWNEKLERKQLKETIMKMKVQIDEANAISKELGTNTIYELDLQSRYPINSGDTEDGFGTYKKISVLSKGINMLDNRSYSWNYQEFADIVQLMKELYQKHLQSGLTSNELQSEESPFFIPAREKHFVGFSHVYLKDLLYLNSLQKEAPVLDLQGQTLGYLSVDLEKLEDAPSPRTLESLSNGQMLQVDRLIGKNVEVIVKINKLSIHNASELSETYCQYKFWNSTVFKSESRNVLEDNVIPFFSEEHFYINDIREDFLNYLDEEAMIVEIWSNLFDSQTKSSLEIHPKPSTEEHKVLASLTIQEMDGNLYKNVITSQEFISGVNTSFKLKRLNKHPRRVSLKFTHIKGQTISVMGCTDAFIRVCGTDNCKILLDSINLSNDTISANWSTSQEELDKLFQLTTNDKKSTSLVVEMGFNIIFSCSPSPITILKKISLKTDSPRKRGLSRTESETEMMKNVNLSELLESREEMILMSGSHFQILIRSVKQATNQISDVIEEQQYFQKLIGTQLTKEKIMGELSLHEKLEATTAVSPLKRSKKQLSDKLQIVLNRSLETGPLKKEESEYFTVELSDTSDRLETRKMGYLKKKSGKEWKKKWFSLGRSHLAMYSNEGDDQFTKLYDITNAKITETESKQYLYTFAIVTWQNVLFLQADSEEEYKKWLDELDPSRKVRESLQNHEKSYHMKYEALMKDFTDSKSKHKDLERDIKEYKQILSLREEEIGSLNDEIEILKHSAQDVIEPSPEIEKLQTENSKLALTLKECEEEIELLNEEIDILREEAELGVKNESDDLHQKIADYKTDVIELEDELEQLQSELNGAIEENSKLKEQLHNSTMKTEELECSSSLSTERIKSLEDKVRELEAVNTGLVEELQDTKKGAKIAMNNGKQEKDDIIDSLQRDLKKSQKALSKQEVVAKKYETDLENSISEFKNQTVLLNSVKKKLNEYEIELDNKVFEINKLKKKISSTSEHDNQKEPRIERKLSSIETVTPGKEDKRTIRKLEKSVAMIEKQLEDRTTELVLANEKIREMTLKQRLQSKEDSSPTVNDSYELQSKIKDLNRELRRKSEELENVVYQNQRAEARNLKKIERLEKEVDRLKAGNAWLEKETSVLPTRKTDTTDYELELIKTRRELEDAKLEIQQMSSQSQEPKLEKFKDLYASSLKLKLKTLVDENLNKDQKIDSLVEKNRTLRLENTSLKKDLDVLLKDKDYAGRGHNNLQKRLKVCEETVLDLENRLQESIKKEERAFHREEELHKENLALHTKTKKLEFMYLEATGREATVD